MLRCNKTSKSRRRLGNCVLDGIALCGANRRTGDRWGEAGLSRPQRRMDNGLAMVNVGSPVDRTQVVLGRPGDNLARQGGGANGQGKMEQDHA